MNNTLTIRTIRRATGTGALLLFAAAASMASCVLFSLVPALQATRPSFQKALVELRSARWRLGKAY